MSKNSVSDWDATAANNGDIAGINIAEGCPAGGINDAIRTLMGQIATWLAAAGGPLLRTGGAMTGAITGMLNGSTIKDAASAERLLGYRGLPKKAITTAYTVTVADVGYCLEVGSGGSIVVPRNSTLIAPNQFSAHDSSIVIQEVANATKSISPATSAVLINVADGVSGAKTLAARGRAVIDLSLGLTDTWFIGGNIS
jgi:hypothetical protein